MVCRHLTGDVAGSRQMSISAKWAYAVSRLGRRLVAVAVWALAKREMPTKTPAIDRGLIDPIYSLLDSFDNGLSDAVLPAAGKMRTTSCVLVFPPRCSRRRGRNLTDMPQLRLMLAIRLKSELKRSAHSRGHPGLASGGGIPHRLEM